VIGHTPVVVGIGGTTRENSSSERLLRVALDGARAAGADTVLLSAAELDLPMYAPDAAQRTERATHLVEAIASADGLIVCSPGYHGGVSGLVKNALDYIEDLREDRRPYLEGRAVGCIVCAYGWQATTTTLTSLRATVHALRGWPTPLGVTANSADPIFGTDGAVVDHDLRQRLEVLGGQVVEFASQRLGVT
jgi:FMN reductase